MMIKNYEQQLQF